MATEFVFIDETGDTGRSGGSVHFAMSLLHVSASNYDAIRQLLAIVRWSFSLYSEIKLGTSKRPAQRILEGLLELSREGVVTASGLCLVKEHYGGRYLTWCNLGVKEDEWPLYLRHYLLRHLLEFHFEHTPSNGPLEIVMDRVSLSESQRANLLAYLNSRPPIPLETPFRIPTIETVTIADSRYVGGLQVAHVLAETLKDVACSKASSELEKLAQLMRLASFLGILLPENE